MTTEHLGTRDGMIIIRVMGPVQQDPDVVAQSPPFFLCIRGKIIFWWKQKLMG